MAPEQHQLGRIVIAGGSVAGWTAAAALAKSLAGLRTRVTLIDLPAAEPCGPTVSTFPRTPAFHRHLDIDEGDLMQAASATFKLGTRYFNWRSASPDFFNAYGTHGRAFGIVPFHQFVLKFRALGDAVDFNDYSMTAVAARLGKLPPPAGDKLLPAGGISYGLQLDSGSYAGYMRSYALQRGVSVVTGAIENVLRRSDGFIEAVDLDTGERVQGDFFVDCSGDGARLANGSAEDEFDDWAQWLPCDRVTSVTAAVQRAPGPYTLCSAIDRGWVQRIPLQHATVNELAWCSRDLDDADAEALLESRLAGCGPVRPETRPVRPGVRRRPWSRNRIAFGRAAGDLEPLEGIELQLLQSGILRFLTMLPDKSANPLLADEYNRLTRREYENVRDFLLLRYHLSDLHGSAFWRRNRAAELPDSLRRRIELFASRGRLALDEYDTFSRDNWISTMLGNGLVPEGYDPLVDGCDLDRIAKEIRRMRQAIRQAAEALPAHGTVNPAPAAT